MEIKELTIKNCEEVLSLWQSTEGVGLDRDVDTKERIGIYLQRNPGLSFAAFEKGKVLGAVLCGHDGRRGYLHHLTVAEAHRNEGIGTALVDKFEIANARYTEMQYIRFRRQPRRSGVLEEKRLG